MEFNVSRLFDAISDRLDDRPCLVSASGTRTYEELNQRATTLAGFLREHGLGKVTRPRSELGGWESGQDHFGILLYNSEEYMEAMLGCMKARVAPFNMNYRYTAAELAYLLADARPRGIIFHAGLQAQLMEAIDRAEIRPDLLIRVPDGSPAAGGPNVVSIEDARPSNRDAWEDDRSPDDVTILYTGGTTGMPKGVLWRQADAFVAQYAGRRRDGSEYEREDEVVERAVAGARSSLVGNPFMHGGGQIWVMLKWMRGGTVYLPPVTSRLVASEIWDTMAEHRVEELSIIGDGFAVPLLDELEQRASREDLSNLKTIFNGGAGLSDQTIARLFALLPHVSVVNAVGSSESGPMAVARADVSDSSAVARFRGGHDAVVLSEDRTRELTEASQEIGWLARRGRLGLGYLGAPEATAETYPTIGDDRYVILGDRARIAADRTIEFLGRPESVINSGGEKVFADEVEAVLRELPKVRDAWVMGRPHPRWGNAVCALVVPEDSTDPPTTDELLAHCRRDLAGYKVPRVVVFVDELKYTEVGKLDIAWARSLLDRSAEDTRTLSGSAPRR